MEIYDSKRTSVIYPKFSAIILFGHLMRLIYRSALFLFRSQKRQKKKKKKKTSFRSCIWFETDIFIKDCFELISTYFRSLLFYIQLRFLWHRRKVLKIFESLAKFAFRGNTVIGHTPPDFCLDLRTYLKILER